MYPVMANKIRTSDPCGFNKGGSRSSVKVPRVRQIPEEGRRTYRPKRCRNNNKDEDNSPKTLNDTGVLFKPLQRDEEVHTFSESISSKIKMTEVWTHFIHVAIVNISH